MPATGGAVVRIASIVLPSLAIAIVALLLVLPESEPMPRYATPADRIERFPADLFDLPPLGNRITIGTPAEAERRRQRLLRYVFGPSRLPSALPTVERDIEDDDFADDLENLERIDRLTIELPLEFTSVAYHVIPQRPNGGLLVYHHGHLQDFLDGKMIIAHFLERGWALLVFAMPYAGLNTNPESIETSRCGRVELDDAGPRTEHDTLACLPRPLRYFLEPVAVGLNHASRLGYQRTVMVGLSGGGWTTTVYTALDVRVQRSYPVASSLPHHISARTCRGETPESRARCFNDIEQRLPGFYRIANYLELYALGASGHRRQLAIYNVYDACCFRGRSYEEWRGRVQDAARRLGCGSYDAVGDTTHRRHRLSPWALDVIEKDLARLPTPCP